MLSILCCFSVDYSLSKSATSSSKNSQFLKRATITGNVSILPFSNFECNATEMHTILNTPIKHLRLLIEKGELNVNAHDKWHNTLLHEATKNGYIDVVQLLIEKKANLNVKDTLGRTPLHYSAYKNCLVSATCLIEKGAAIDEKDNFYKTPLHVGIEKNNVEIIKLLKYDRADITVKNIQNQPA